MGKNIAVLGKGGRESMFTYMLKKSYDVENVYVLPGNGGTQQFAINVPGIKLDGGDGYKEFLNFLNEKSIDSILGGSETDHVLGDLTLSISDVVRLNEFNFFGVSSAAALFEGSKIRARDFMHHQNIPHPEYRAFDNEEDGIEYARQKFKDGVDGLFIKADGLCGGKGAIKVENEDKVGEVIGSLKPMFKEAGSKYLIEQMLKGPEISATVLTDGDSYGLFKYTQDYKPVGKGDKGLNTGGMGSVTLKLRESLDKKIRKEIVEPSIDGANKIGRPIKGVLYIAIMVENNQPYVLEYNVRFGDPECQVFLPILKSDFLEALELTNAVKLHKYKLVNQELEAALVNMASVGYPENYKKSLGREIFGIEEAAKLRNILINHAGTKYEDGHILTNGSRVLNIIGFGKRLKEAIANAYKGVDKIRVEDNALFYRPDIGCNAPKISLNW